VEQIMTNLNADTKLQISDLSKSFGDLQALRSLNLDVSPGEFIALVGPSGCGKTTLLRILAGLEEPDEGGIWIDGHEVTGPGSDRAVVFQSDCLLPWRSVWRNTVIGLEINGRLGETEKAYASSLLHLVGLKGFEKFFPRQLSGGMRQRANLARALSVQPEVLLMDEPFSALDAQTREIMQVELLRIWEAGKKTVLFITHQIDEAVFLADKVVVLGRRPGRIRKILPVELGRPRPLGIKRTPEFVALVDTIWHLIEQDVRQSINEESALGASGAG
jgi:NitT/TauT family transport system ATP-binding protein